jgi:hypothetical protein
MSAKGMMLSSYSWCRYVFDEGFPNEYTYRIELLEHVPTHPESMAYIRFLEQNGIECVATNMRWIYLRRKSSEGAFDIYSDLESKIKHYQRINVLWTIVIVVALIGGITNLLVGIINLNIGERLGNFLIGNLIIGSLLFALSLFFWRIGAPSRRKIKNLQQEIKIRE